MAPALFFALDSEIRPDSRNLRLADDRRGVDGIPDSVSFSVPADFAATATYDAADLDGELDVSIVDPMTPLAILPDGVVVTITLTTTCLPAGTPIVAAVAFSDLPPTTFGDVLGQDVPGRCVDGSITILPGIRGDCNDDDSVTAGDLSACVLEVFDGDGDFWLDVPGGSFMGSPVGCDANADGCVDAGDLSCRILLIFQGPGACSASGFRRAGWGQPLLYLDGALKSREDPFTGMSVPVYFQPRGWEINSLVFSLDYDQKAFAFDPGDKDGDGIPDAVRIDLPAGAQVTVSFDRADADGEIDVAILDPGRALDPGREPLLMVKLRPLAASPLGSGPPSAGMRFSRDPAASFGDLSGHSVEGSTNDGRR